MVQAAVDVLIDYFRNKDEMKSKSKYNIHSSTTAESNNIVISDSTSETSSDGALEYTSFKYRTKSRRRFGEYFNEASGLYPELKRIMKGISKQDIVDKHYHVMTIAGSGNGKTASFRHLMDVASMLLNADVVSNRHHPDDADKRAVLPIYLNCGGGEPGMTPTMAIFLRTIDSLRILDDRRIMVESVHNNVYLLLLAHVIVRTMYDKFQAADTEQSTASSSSSSAQTHTQAHIRQRTYVKMFNDAMLSPQWQGIICIVYEALVQSKGALEELATLNKLNAVLLSYLSTQGLVVLVDEFWSLLEPKAIELRRIISEESSKSHDVYPSNALWYHSTDVVHDKLLLRSFRSGLLSIKGCISCVTDTTSHIFDYLPMGLGTSASSTAAAQYDASSTPDPPSIRYIFCTSVSPPTYDQAIEYLTKFKCFKSHRDTELYAQMCHGWWFPLGVVANGTHSYVDLLEIVMEKAFPMNKRTSLDVTACLVQACVLGARGGTPSHLLNEMVRFWSASIDKMTLEKQGEENINVIFNSTMDVLTRRELEGRRLNLIEITMPSSLILARAVLEHLYKGGDKLIDAVENALCSTLLGPQAYERYPEASKAMLGECLPIYRLCMEAYRCWHSVWNTFPRISDDEIDYVSSSSASSSKALMSNRDHYQLLDKFIDKGVCFPCCFRHAEVDYMKMYAAEAYILGVGFVRAAQQTPEDCIIVGPKSLSRGSAEHILYPVECRCRLKVAASMTKFVDKLSSFRHEVDDHAAFIFVTLLDL